MRIYKHFFLILCLLIARTIECSGHMISFIMPCYNCADTVQRSLDSIYVQNLIEPFEIICVDDGSTDTTLSILNECKRNHNNVHVIVHDKNMGAGAAANTAVYHSKGDLIFRLDSDNILCPNSIGLLVALIDNTGCDGATFQELKFFSEYLIQHSSWKYTAPGNICDLQHCISVGQDPAHSGNYLYTRKSFDRAGGYPARRGGTDTFCFGFKQYATGSRIAILPNSYYWHFHNPNGYWYREERSGRNHELTLATFREFNEVFSSQTNAYLQSSHVGNPMGDQQRQRLTLASSEILNDLFQGYHYLSEKQYEKALNSFKHAVLHGCISIKISEIIRNLEIRL